MSGQYKFPGEGGKDKDLEEEYEGHEKQCDKEFYDTGEGDEEILPLFCNYFPFLL